jgi:guanidinoacetate N-methyltransferase
VLYDPYPSGEHDQHTHQFHFLKAIRNKIKVGGRLTYCNLTSLGVLKNKPEYNDPAKSHEENWDALMKGTQIPHLVEAGWKEEECTFSVYELPADAIEKRENQTNPDGTKGCAYYAHSTCLIPYLIRKA